MPQNATGESGIPETATAPPHYHIPAGTLFAGGALLLLAASGLIYHYACAARRAWKRYASEVDGEFAPLNRRAPRYVSGSIAERAFFMETAVSTDDDAPYFHTKSSMPVTNPGQLILGLRRKSMLEEAQTRGGQPAYEFGDSDFDRRFQLAVNDVTALDSVLDKETRKSLLRYNDVEVYVRVNTVEWRRSGEVSDLNAIRKLNLELARIADAIDNLPRRSLPLSQRLADEEMISKGV